MYLATHVHRIQCIVYVRQYYACMQVYFGCRSDSLNQKLIESSRELQKLQLELADRKRENEQLRNQLLGASLECQKMQLELADCERENELLRKQLLGASRQDLNQS